MSTMMVLGELRHECKMCGGSCQSSYVRLLGDEAERIANVAKLLDVDDPIRDGKLRLVGGRCVFLGDDNLCNIHRQFGAQAKPQVCQQFPMIALRVPGGVRVGVDPGCYHTADTWRDGPPVVSGNLIATPVEIAEDEVRYEEMLLDLCANDGVTVPMIVGALTGEAPPADGTLQAAFAKRLIQRLQAGNLDLLLEVDDAAPRMIETLLPVLEQIRAWDPADPPPWPAIDADEQEFAVDVVQRMIYLRLAHDIPVVAGAGLLLVAGIIACGWAMGGTPGFGPALSGWTRAIRARLFWRAITPDAPTMTWLARGIGAPTSGALP